MDNWKEVASSILNAFQKRNQKKLRKINDDLLKETIVSFTKMLYQLAVLSYVLSKIISKPRFLKKENEKKMGIIESSIDSIVKTENEEDAFNKSKDVVEAIRSLEKDDLRFLIDLMTKG